jgi:hypothetical protein
MRLGSTLVWRTLPDWYDLRQYQPCTNTSLLGTRDLRQYQSCTVLYQLQYQAYTCLIPAQNLSLKHNTRTKLVWKFLKGPNTKTRLVSKFQMAPNIKTSQYVQKFIVYSLYQTNTGTESSGYFWVYEPFWRMCWFGWDFQQCNFLLDLLSLTFELYKDTFHLGK